MAEGPTREETEQRLEAIFSSALEGEELEKMIDSIPKRIEKFEGKWGGLIGWAEKKYGVPEDSQDEPEAVAEEPEAVAEEPEAVAEEPEAEAEKKPKKKRGLMSRFRKSKDESDEAEAEEEQPEAEAEQPDEESEGDPEGLDWEEPEGTDSETSEESEESAAATDIESTLELIQSGESESALASLKAMISTDASNPEAWRGMAAYFDSVGMAGRSKACEEKAEALS